MVLSSLASFRGYCLASLALTTAVISHGVYTKRFFYRTVVYLSLSKFAILAVGNMALVSFLLVWRLIQAIFLGPLRFREVERLHLRARDAIIECCFALTIFREEFNVRFLALVTTLLLLKSLHWLTKDRIEFLEEQPLTPTLSHVRLVGLMAFLFAVDARLVAMCALHTFRASSGTMLVLFAFEFTVLLIELVSNVVRYVLHIVDLYLESRWEAKGLYSFYNELLSDMCHLAVYVAFFVYVQLFYTFPFHIIRDLYLTFSKFQKRCSDFLRYRRVMATMNELFADATEEELAAGDRTCIICREEMRTAKKLNCGHMFHARCLQSWLKRQLSCPTCRSPVDVSETATPANGNANDAAAAPGAPGNAGGDGAAAQAAGNGNLPPWAGAAAQGPAPGNRGPMPGPAPQPGVNQEGGQGAAGLMNVVNAWWNMLRQMARVDPGGFGRQRGQQGQMQRPPLLGRPPHGVYRQPLHRPPQQRWPLPPHIHAAYGQPGYPGHPAYAAPPVPPGLAEPGPHNPPPLPPHLGGPPYPPHPHAAYQMGPPVGPLPAEHAAVGEHPSQQAAPRAPLAPGDIPPGFPATVPSSEPTAGSSSSATRPQPALGESSATPTASDSTNASTAAPPTSGRAGPREATVSPPSPNPMPVHPPMQMTVPEGAPGVGPSPFIGTQSVFNYFPPPGHGAPLPPRGPSDYPLGGLLAMQESIEAIYAQIQGVTVQTEFLREQLQQLVLDATATAPAAAPSAAAEPGSGSSPIVANPQQADAAIAAAIAAGAQTASQESVQQAVPPAPAAASEVAEGSAVSSGGSSRDPAPGAASSTENDMAEVMRQRRLRYLQRSETENAAPANRDS